MEQPTKTQREFMRRLTRQWMPAFCADSVRQYDPSGFQSKAVTIADADARDFMKAVDAGLVLPDSRQRFGMRRGRSSEAMFWETARTAVPRRFSIWAETVITAAAAARLHFEHGWPAIALGMQPDEYSAFDLGAFSPPDFAQLHIAAEIKATVAKLAILTRNLHRCCAGDHDKDCLNPKAARRNAHKKWAALHTIQPPLLWLVGPSQQGQVYQLSYRPSGDIEMHAADSSLLKFSQVNH